MAGHSKWANIKRRKGAQDVARGKLFTKLIREITVAARLGGTDPEANPRLRQAVDKGRANSMPKNTIERAIAKGGGELVGDDYETLTYEGYGPGGVAILVQCLTDNRNRTASDVRYAFSKAGSAMATAGAVSYLFQRKGVFMVPVAAVDEDSIMMAALEAGADDVTDEGEEWCVVCESGAYDACREALEALDVGEISGEITQVPDNTVEVGGDDVDTLMRLLERLEDLDDVQETFTNADFPEDPEDQG